MKKLILLMLYIVFSTLAFAQNSAPNRPFEVQNVRITKTSESTGMMGSGGGSGSLVTGGTFGGVTEDNNWRIEYRIKNISDKVITRIGWQFKILNSKDQSNREFKNKMKLKPNKEANISEPFNADAILIPANPNTELNITYVEFEDGSIWQHPVPKPEDNDLK
ncbi:MAG: hypothetical protein JNN15_06250 [Blastocatellia bacterium]|nr:hypothetical protein [Blastocatellia bacterium]